MAERVRVMRLWMWIGVVAAMSALTGCGSFFVYPGNGGGGTTTGNVVYVANFSSNSMAGFSISTTGTLTAVPSSPSALGFAPVAAVVTPTNNFLYVAGPGAIYVYVINADGSLSSPSTGAVVAAVTVVSLDISPDGNWLFGLDSTKTVIDQFQINKSTGALAAVAITSYTVPSGVVVPKAIRVSPDGTL